jgi:ATP synthase protein I
MDPDPSEQKKPKPSNNYLRYSGLGLQLLLTIGVAAWGGYKLDRYIGIKFPAFLLTFVFLAFGGSMYFLWRQLNKEQ